MKNSTEDKTSEPDGYWHGRLAVIESMMAVSLNEMCRGDKSRAIAMGELIQSLKESVEESIAKGSPEEYPGFDRGLLSGFKRILKFYDGLINKP